jgi:hypothetical protein
MTGTVREELPRSKETHLIVIGIRIRGTMVFFILFYFPSVLIFSDLYKLIF